MNKEDANIWLAITIMLLLFLSALITSWHLGCKDQKELGMIESCWDFKFHAEECFKDCEFFGLEYYKKSNEGCICYSLDELQSKMMISIWCG